jgi:hypothetical protein
MKQRFFCKRGQLPLDCEGVRLRSIQTAIAKHRTCCNGPRLSSFTSLSGQGLQTLDLSTDFAKHWSRSIICSNILLEGPRDSASFRYSQTSLFLHHNTALFFSQDVNALAARVTPSPFCIKPPSIQLQTLSEICNPVLITLLIFSGTRSSLSRTSTRSQPA